MEFSDQLPEGNVNVTHESPLKEMAVLLTALVGIALVVYIVLGFLVDFAVQRLTPEQEQVLTIPFSAGMSSSSKLPEISGRLQAIVDSIQSDCADFPYPIKVVVVEEEQINAVALPGGTIWVFSGLLDKMKSENELTFILGHELGHFKNKDHLRGMGRAVVLLVLSIVLLGSDNAVGDLIANSIDMVNSAFTREQESAADAFALTVLQCRYGHVGGATEFFETLKTEEGDLSLFGHFLASHPDNQKRIDELNAQAAQADYPRKPAIPLNL